MTDPTPTPTLKPAAQNPWYLLATLYGEPDWPDRELQDKNRVAWNRYYASTWTDEQREVLKGRVDAAELVPFDDEELRDIRRRFRERAGDNQIRIPDANQWVDFAACEFSQHTAFRCYVFGRVDFSGSSFLGIADFIGSTFQEECDFKESIFKKYCKFDKSYFLSDAVFIGTKFYEDTYFRLSAFHRRAYFSHSEITKEIYFIGVKFIGDSDFSNVIFTDNTYFGTARFSKGVYFINSELKAPTDFEGSQFLGEPPRFHGATLHEDTVWRGVEWPVAPTDPDKAGRFTDAYERLKQEMDRLKKHEDELMFFAEELKCRRVAAGRLKGLPIAAYGWFCGYGRSYLKPLAWMVGLFGAGVPALYFLQPGLGWGTAVGMSAVNCLAGLGIRKDLMGKVLDSLGPGALIVSGVQTVLGLILLFLIGLGLRNRFRMK